MTKQEFAFLIALPCEVTMPMRYRVVPAFPETGRAQAVPPGIACGVEIHGRRRQVDPVPGLGQD